MKLARRIGAFLRAPATRKGLALEAAWELLRARILTRRGIPAMVYLGLDSARLIFDSPINYSPKCYKIPDGNIYCHWHNI